MLLQSVTSGSSKEYIKNKLRLHVEAGAIALDVFQQNPNHPCAAHYAIHAFDHPNLARLALPSAQRYAKIAPSSHHAQHMPAHIFVQLGMWPEAAKSNENGWATSKKWVEREKLPKSKRDYHSLQWLHYVYLQQGLIDKAEAIFKICLQNLTFFFLVLDLRNSFAMQATPHQDLYQDLHCVLY